MPFSLSRRFLYAMTSMLAWATLACAVGARPLMAQGASDIFLIPIHQDAGRVMVDGVERVTNRDGYNNQPAFLRDGRLVFTCVYQAGPDGQADIWIYEGAGRSHGLTKTAPESEYSAYHIPGADRFAVIRVEADSAQRLWSFDLNGENPQPVLTRLKPIGYQAWIDAGHVAVYVLGDNATRTPSTLQLVTVAGEVATPITTGIGRALQTVPGRAAVSFTHRDSANVRWIDMYDIASKQISHVMKTLATNEYHVWLPDGTLLSAEGSKLYQMKPGSDAEWKEVADLSDRGIKGITRMAVSIDGKKIALVAAH